MKSGALVKGRGGLFMLKLKPQEVCLLCQSWKAGVWKKKKPSPTLILFWEFCHQQVSDWLYGLYSSSNMVYTSGSQAFLSHPPTALPDESSTKHPSRSKCVHLNWFQTGCYLIPLITFKRLPWSRRVMVLLFLPCTVSITFSCLYL